MKIISVHCPKAGGTALCNALSSAFGSSFETDYSEDPADPRSPRNLDPDSYFSRNRTVNEHVFCLHGHFHPGQFDLSNVFLFTVLRYPVENIISIYSFWKQLPSQGQPLHDYFVSRRLNVFETARLPLLRFLYSKTYFGSFDMSRFDLIGRHDARQEALQRLGRVAGLTIESSVQANTTAPTDERDELLANPSCLRQLEDILREDIRFYERVCT